MRDIIWTLIVIWLIYKIVSFFKNAALHRSQSGPSAGTNGTAPQRSPRDIESAIHKSLEKEGQYVDYEEIK